MSKILTRADILAAQDLKTISCEVPEWGGTVYVRELNALDMEAFQVSIRDASGALKTSLRERLLAVCLVDESGNRLFAEEEFIELGKKNSAVLARVFETAQTLNGLGAAHGDTVKNSEGDLSAASNSGSPLP